MASFEKKTRQSNKLFKTLMECQTKVQNVFSVISEHRSWNSDLKLQESRLQLNVKKKIQLVEAVQMWSQLLRKVMSSYSLMCLSRELIAICQRCFHLDSCTEQRVGLCVVNISSNSNSVIWFTGQLKIVSNFFRKLIKTDQFQKLKQCQILYFPRAILLENILLQCR